MGYFPDEAQGMFRNSNPLVSVVRGMPIMAKQAMYCAADKNLIKRHTWNGCAWNAAGENIGGGSIKSIQAAAEAFSCSTSVVSSFISAWDNLPGSDTRCTILLKEALEEVGINSDPSSKRLTRVVRGYAYKSLDTQFKEELADIDCIEDIPGMSDEMACSMKVLLKV